MELSLPEFSLVLLIGASGSGKTTFAARHFSDSQVISSDRCRAMVAGNEDDQDATDDAFALLHQAVDKRLARGIFTLVDATNLLPESRKALLDMAKKHHCGAHAIVLDPGTRVCHAHNRQRPNRKVEPRVIRLHHGQLKQALDRIKKERFAAIHHLASQREIDKVRIAMQPMPANLKHETGPFDLIGDVHGCYRELKTLLKQLGYRAEGTAKNPSASHPDGRRAVFLGDLVDRGPDSPGVLRLVMAMVVRKTAFCLPGNHDMKLLRKLRGRDVVVRYGLAETLTQFENEPESFKTEVGDFLESLTHHLVLDGGKLVAAHAGMKEELQGRDTPGVRAFALYGETTGETDAFGLPIRYDWARDYRGRARVVYGHTPVRETAWQNRTLCIDTGCVFGGKLTALRYPEMELVQVDARSTYYQPAKPLE